MTLFFAACAPEPSYELWWSELEVLPSTSTDVLETDLVGYEPAEEVDDEGWESSRGYTHSVQGFVVRIDRGDDDSCVVRAGTNEWAGTCTDTAVDVMSEGVATSASTQTHVSGYRFSHEDGSSRVERVTIEHEDGVGVGVYDIQVVDDDAYAESDLWNAAVVDGESLALGYEEGWYNHPERVDCLDGECEVHVVSTMDAAQPLTWRRLPVDERAENLFWVSNPPGAVNFTDNRPR